MTTLKNEEKSKKYNLCLRICYDYYELVMDYHEICKYTILDTFILLSFFVN